MTEQLAIRNLSEEVWKIAGLAAKGPMTGMEDKLALFGQFVGDWDILEIRYFRPDGTWEVSRGELHWRWILEGRALQDVWMTIDEKTQKPVPDGTTVRFYEPKIDAWRGVWVSPTQDVMRTFIGQKVGDEIVVEAKTDEGYSVKWIFSDITPNFFRWHSEESRDNGITWRVIEDMRIRRREKAEVEPSLME